MTDQPLSPAAQAIMVAATNGNFNVVNDPVYKQCIAAALRAAANDWRIDTEFIYGVEYIRTSTLEDLADALEDLDD